MKKAGKIVLYVLAILLLGIFSQQETRAEETSERYYSRTYSVLSANVGNSFPFKDTAGLKLQPDSDEEAKVRFWINKLKPDIAILIEAYDYDQVDSLTGRSYSIYGGPYDFICIKSDIGYVINDVQMNPGDGNGVGYVDVVLEDEDGRKVRLFYVHFPSPGGGWTVPLHQAHENAFLWISRNIDFSIPCLIAGDLNNDFIGEKDDNFNIWCPVACQYFNSSRKIYDKVRELDLWIFNPLTSTTLQIPDGSTERDYEDTYIPDVSTLDWVMGSFVEPRGIETIPSSFVTNPPDWWTGIWRIDYGINFDHKPLYGKVVFFWEDRTHPLFFRASEDDKHGYIDKTGKFVIEPQFDEARDFSEGLAAVKIRGKWGFIDKTGNIVIEPQFDEARDFSEEDLAAVKIKGKCGYIDKTSKFVIEPQFDSVGGFYEGLASVKIRGKWGFIDKTGKIVIEPKFDEARNFFEGLAVVEIKGKWGFIDRTGKIVIEPKFDWIGYFWPFSGEELTVVEIKGKRGFIDKTGKIVIEPKFDSVGYFSEGLAPVRIGDEETGRWGYINKIGKFVVNPQFDYVWNFSGGLAVVKIRDKYGVIDRTGKFFLNPQFDYIRIELHSWARRYENRGH